MNNFVTLDTNWKNKQWFRIIRMMILCAFFQPTHKTSLSVCRFKFTNSNSPVYSIMCFANFGITKSVAFILQFAIFFSFFALFILFLRNLIFLTQTIPFLTSFIIFCLVIEFNTYFTINFNTIFCSAIFVKFRKRLNLFAFGTFFRYDLLSHIRFLSKRVWLELVTKPLFVPARFILQQNINLSRGKYNDC